MENFLIPLLFWILCGLFAFVIEWYHVTKINHLEYFTFNNLSIGHIVCIILCIILGPLFLLIALISASDDLIDRYF